MNRKFYLSMIQSISGWHYPGDFYFTSRVLDHILAKQNPPEVHFIEIGIFNGRSFLPISHYFYDKITSFYACDIFADPNEIKLFKSHLYKYLPRNYESKIHILQEDSMKLADHFPKDTFAKKFIYCSIDANHSYRHTLADLRFCAERVHDKGIILLDDVFQFNWPEVSNAMYDFLRENKEFSVAFILLNKVILVKDRSIVNEMYDPALFTQQNINGESVNIVLESLYRKPSPTN